jgi:hypothetical protein
MIYVVLNILISVFLVWLSFYVDRHSGGSGEPVFGSALMQLSVCGVLNAVVLLASAYAPPRLTIFLCRLLFVVLGFFSVQICFFCSFFPYAVKNKIVLGFKWILWLLCFWVVFSQINSITVSPYLGITRVEAVPFFNGYLWKFFRYTWFDVYNAIIVFFLPALSVLVMLLRTENMNLKMEFQKSVMLTAGVVICWLSCGLLAKTARFIPLFSTVLIFSPTLLVIIFVRTVTINMLYDLRSFVGAALHFVFFLLLPSVFTGCAFIVFWHRYREFPVASVFFLLLVIVTSLIFSYQSGKIFNKLSWFRSARYAGAFEQDLARIDYSNEPAQVMQSMQDIFAKNIGTSTIHVLIDNGVDTLESVFDADATEHITVALKNSVIDSLVSSGKTIIFRNFSEVSEEYDGTKQSVNHLFDRTGSDALIILNEGLHVFGVVLLGPKAAGNTYNGYDYEVFKKLYSYFFVFGYYMKNIANQSVVGTVNREIRMSAQIITSIQENVDQVKNSKIDVGSLMVPAHNIGGEFIDLIRLSEDRHIFVLGDLSGKGISASMSMVIIKSIIRTFLAETKDFKLLVQKVNTFIRYNLPKGTFFEGVFGLFDFTDDTLYYINCGIPALFLYTRAYNNVIEIQGEGRVLGFAKDIGPLIKVKKVILNPGDIVMGCTDGLIDALSLRGEQFGKDRVQKTITENSMYPAEKMAQFSYDALVKFMSKELEDDVSILVIKRLTK